MGSRAFTDCDPVNHITRSSCAAKPIALVTLVGIRVARVAGQAGRAVGEAAAAPHHTCFSRDEANTVDAGGLGLVVLVVGVGHELPYIAGEVLVTEASDPEGK